MEKYTSVSAQAFQYTWRRNSCFVSRKNIITFAEDFHLSISEIVQTYSMNSHIFLHEMNKLLYTGSLDFFHGIELNSALQTIDQISKKNVRHTETSPMFSTYFSEP